MSNGSPVMVSIPGYPPREVPGGVPSTNDAGGIEQMQAVYTIPPVVWMFIFLVVGYVGMCMLLED